MDTSGAGHVGLEAGVQQRADGLRVLRADMADGVRTLCVCNTGSGEARFDLDELSIDGVLPRFSGGAMRTSESPAGGTVCHLAAGNHVCLTLGPGS